ncbi:hypothetical protein FRX31_023206 [Thalictrum thalictroides]|uniref:Uncharacterized protein n=1 Tax=Thalictrum thalictroides TaxID=46969 RepID=A0A7J6VRK0_THATH|nr:hypothetical protein FRX31_023206 [Thalictrum thalictroides]
MLLDIEDDATWYSADSKDEDAVKSSTYRTGKECLYCLSLSGEDTFFFCCISGFASLFGCSRVTEKSCSTRCIHSNCKRLSRFARAIPEAGATGPGLSNG